MVFASGGIISAGTGFSGSVGSSALVAAAFNWSACWAPACAAAAITSLPVDKLSTNPSRFEYCPIIPSISAYDIVAFCASFTAANAALKPDWSGSACKPAIKS